jgi:hypothetical protein
MAENLPGSGDRDQPPGERPIQPEGGHAAPPEPQPYSQQYGYGQPGYGSPPAPQTEGSATAALVIAIVGFFVCPPVGAIVALVLANSARQRIETSGGRLTGLEQARAARIIAIVELVLTAIVVLLVVLLGAIALTTSGGSEEQLEPVPSVTASKLQPHPAVDPPFDSCLRKGSAEDL